MKNIKIILTLFSCSLLLFSCEEDTSTGLEFSESAQITVVAGERTFYDLTEVATTTVDLELDALGNLPVESVVIIKSYNGGPFVDHATISSLPVDISVPLSEAVIGLDVTLAELELGDNITFGFRANLTNGTVAISKNIFVANLSCPSNIPEGTWTGVNNDVSNFGVTSTNAEVTITADGAGAYSVSDVSGGAYFACCAGLGFNRDQPVTILDVCNVITVTGSTGSQVTIGDDAANQSTWNPDTGVLTIFWCDNTNGFCSETSFTKN